MCNWALLEIKENRSSFTDIRSVLMKEKKKLCSWCYTVIIIVVISIEN